MQGLLGTAGATAKFALRTAVGRVPRGRRYHTATIPIRTCCSSPPGPADGNGVDATALLSLLLLLPFALVLLLVLPLMLLPPLLFVAVATMVAVAAVLPSAAVSASSGTGSRRSMVPMGMPST